MKRIIPILLLSFLLMLSPTLADNPTINVSSGNFMVNFRTFAFNDTECYSSYTCYPNGSICSIPPETSCQGCTLQGKLYNGSATITMANSCLNYIIVDNVDKKNFNLLVKIFPMPFNPCFSEHQTCNITDWNPVASLILPTESIRTVSVDIDTTQCWNWWNASTDQLRADNATKCPVASIYVSSDEAYKRIEFSWGNGTGADADYEIIFLGYSTSVVNIEQKISPSLSSVMASVAQLISINLDIWKVLYYLFLIGAIIVAVIIIVGVLPLSLKWILKKITA
jgi:hypothetical protein